MCHFLYEICMFVIKISLLFIIILCSAFSQVPDIIFPLSSVPGPNSIILFLPLLQTPSSVPSNVTVRKSFLLIHALNSLSYFPYNLLRHSFRFQYFHDFFIFQLFHSFYLFHPSPDPHLTSFNLVPPFFLSIHVSDPYNKTLNIQILTNILHNSRSDLSYYIISLFSC